jgi:hypothetical protein
MVDVAGVLVLVGGAIAVFFAGAVVVGFGVLFRRGRQSRQAVTSRSGMHPTGMHPGRAVVSGEDHADPTVRANILLVRADDAVRDAEDELGFAMAQFGGDATTGLSRALADARQRVMEAFALQQRLDDHIPDSEAQRRDWTARIVNLCQTAQSDLATQLEHFDELRALDRNAPANLAALRAQLLALSRRRDAAAEIADALGRTYAPAALASISDNIEQASEALEAAARSAEAADAALGGDPVAAASDSAADAIRNGEDSARRAAHLVDAIDTLSQQLDKAGSALSHLIDATRANLAEARAMRDDAPDAEAGQSVNDAIARTESTLAAVDSGDPVASLDRLREVNATLDTSLAGARNQQRRLEGARIALEGALVSARSQLSATRDFIATRRGGVGSEARTRLAEAARLLTVAEAEADPVLALDTARSAATYARDADALARYDVLR